MTLPRSFTSTERVRHSRRPSPARRLSPLAALLGVFAVLLLPLSLGAADGAYVFSYFTGRGDDGLKLAWSTDGRHWHAVANGRSLLRPEVGEARLMRDPHLLQGPDGTFHLVWTTAWEGQTIGYAHSRDLIHWSEQQAIPVMQAIPGTRNCWAPEVVYDAGRQEFVLFWSSTVEGRFPETAGQSEDNYNHRIYACTTTDWRTFTPARLLYDPGFSVIDATFARASDGSLHLVIKDERRDPVKKHLRTARADSFLGPFGPLLPPFTGDWVEGPTALNVDDAVIVYYDVYRERRYEARLTRDFKTWEDVPELSLPAGLRHGTAIPVPATVLASLRNLPAE